MAGDYFSTDTIAAVATSLAGDGGVGIIRVSGPQALSAARKVSRGLESADPRFLHRIEIVREGAALDDGLGVYFPNGQSFTGEDVVELQLHGGRFLLQNVLNLLIGTGLCRLALPGEFSFRAVRNGKLTLSGAEAVGQLIRAKSMFEVQAARRRLSAARTRDFDEIASKLRDLLAQSELSIDFIDQDVEVISAAKMKGELVALAEKCEQLLAQMSAAQRIARGLQLTLLGAPNTGKSTLFNALLAEDRAIVSPEAGTTRDVITEELVIGPYYVRLADTAGLRFARGAIEREGITRAKGLAEESDLVILVVDAAQPAESLMDTIAQGLSSHTHPIVVLNKWDMVDAAGAQERREAVTKLYSGPVVALSAAKGSGVATLLETMRRSLDSRYGLGILSFLPTEFQLQMLLECRAAVAQVVELIGQSGLSQPELVSAGLNSAVRALSDLVGETTPDTVLTKIFSEFCIGK